MLYLFFIGVFWHGLHGLFVGVVDLVGLVCLVCLVIWLIWFIRDRRIFSFSQDGAVATPGVFV